MKHNKVQYITFPTSFWVSGLTVTHRKHKHCRLTVEFAISIYYYKYPIAVM